MPPLIGITTRPKQIGASAGRSDAHTLLHTYTDGVLAAGGLPVLLAPVPNPRVDELLERIDGLVLSGGGDVDPARYGGTMLDSVYGVDFDRDEFEIQVVKRSAQRRLPTLAICRGLQILNVALGGTLIEDIPTEIGSADHSLIGDRVFDGHQHVRLEPGSRVARVVGATELLVNSIHHQAVRDLASGFRAVAWADDGIVEAIEPKDGSWPLLAVQWHPEYLDDLNYPASKALFGALVEEAATRA